MRKLLLLANPGVRGCDNWAPQVLDVLERYRQYFQSPVGGYWSDDEIVPYTDIPDPAAEASWVATHIADMTRNAEYSMIVFVGHGGVMQGQDQIQLSKGALCPVSCLTDGMGLAIKRTVIIDACRSFIGATPQLLLEEQRTFSQAGLLLETHCRDFYNEIWQNSSPHVELLQSTQYGMPARTTDRGTAFSDVLLNTVGGRTPLWNHLASVDPSREVSRSNQEVLQEACKSMGIFVQVPEITSTDGSFSFPFFAVRRK